MTEHNITIYRGDTVPFLLQMQTDEAGNPWSSWGDYRLFFTVKEGPDDSDSDAKVSKDSMAGGGITLLLGKAYWEHTFAELQAGLSYVYDIQLVNTSIGRVVTLVAGKLTIRRDITQTA